jgi:hypothetical protein
VRVGSWRDGSVRTGGLEVGLDVGTGWVVHEAFEIRGDLRRVVSAVIGVLVRHVSVVGLGLSGGLVLGLGL